MVGAQCSFSWPKLYNQLIESLSEKIIAYGHSQTSDIMEMTPVITDALILLSFSSCEHLFYSDSLFTE